MSQQTENVRVRRTRKLLREALIDLIEQKGFEKVTVAEITDRALISRAAFYRTHRDKYDLVAQIYDEAMAALLGTVDDATPVTTPATTPAAERWVAFFEHIDTYHRFYAAMLGRKGSPWFADRMRAALSEMVTAHLPATGTDLVPAVLGAMFAQSITWWLEAGRPVPPREIAATSARLAGAVIREAAAPDRSP
ncbi:transcriptional regulator, TetR family [Catenulispora acidiphila DSM 44928]|uniref:Transcriptional regulator, TetR family n=1 Tax=Catenulispora acidiphila (strain DSM 44928 / JCM 14897 / NBRC 102108 / NRRL B-24433 / ID139908) TaxID=479433 RepID=C7Q7J3_CATAD|nr:TetR/AcrR family transcriptional regulator [Catenulispora acidiphila]ACU72186.1 transcriptional regulator, TetR family [Catenulispora acidiphila DSM 44928]